MPLKFALRTGILFFITLASILQVHAADTPPTIAQAASASPNPVTANSTTLSVLGADDGGEANLVYTWTAVGTPPSSPVFSINSNNAAKVTQVSLSKAGTYKFQVTIQDGAGQTITSPQLTVTVSKVLTSIVVTPSNSAIDPSGTKQFAASAKDQFGNAMTATFAWSVNAGGSVDGTGLFTSDGTSGTFTVTATSGTISGTNTVRVNSAPTVATPATGPNPVTTKTAALSVLGADDGGEAALKYFWAMTNGPAAVSFNRNNSNAAKNVVATFMTDGSYDFTITITDARGLSVTSSVTLQVVRSLATITIVPGSANVPLNGSKLFAATGKDQFGALLVIQPTFTWSATGPGSVVSTGLYSAPGTTGGPYVLTASSGTVSDTSQITVINTAPTVAQAITYTPHPVKTTAAILDVLGADDGGESNLTYTWSATGPGPVTLGANGTNASKEISADFVKAGNYDFSVTITDSYGLTKVSTKTVSVLQAVTSITVTPSTVVLNPGDLQQFSGMAVDQFGDPLVTQPAFAWSKSGGGTITTTSLFTAGATPGGPYSVFAKNGGKTGTATVNIVANTAPTIALAAAASPNPVTGTTASLSVLGGDDTGEAKLFYTWSATGPAAVSFSSNGTNAAKNIVATFSQLGAYTLTATIQDAPGLNVTSSVNVTVSPTLTTLQLTPASASISLGGTQDFTPSGSDQFGNPLLVLPALNWTVSGGGTIDTAGHFTATSLGGPFGVTANYNSAIGNASISVIDAIAPIVSGLTPLNGSATSTAHPTFGATFSDVGSGVNPSSVVIVLDGTDITALTSVSASGFSYTPHPDLSVGSHYLTVSLSDFAGNPALATSTFTVPPPIVQGVTFVNAATATPNPVVYSSTQLHTLANDPAGELYLVYKWDLVGQNPAPVTYISNDSNAAKNTTVAFTKAGIYHFSVTATNADNLSGSSYVDVSVPSLPSGIVLSPQIAYVNPGLTQQFTAQVVDQFGTPTANQPESFTWTKDSYGDGSIDNNGLFTAGDQISKYYIQASSGDFTGNALVSWDILPSGNYSLSPNPVTANPGDQIQFMGKIFGYDENNYPNIPTTWSVDRDGNINASGLLTLPVNASGQYTVTGVNPRGDIATATVTVASPPVIVHPASATPLVTHGTSVQLSVLADDPAGEASLQYYWAPIENPVADVAFDDDGTNSAKNTTAHFTAPGTYTLNVRVINQDGLSVVSRVNVRVIQTPTSLVASVSNSNVAAGTAVLATAQVSDQFNFMLNGSPVQWSVDTGGSIDQNGVFTAAPYSTGDATITASLGTLSSSVTVHINPAGTPGLGNLKIASGLTGDMQGNENGQTVYYTKNHSVQVLYTQDLGAGPVQDVVFTATSDLADSASATVSGLTTSSGTAFGDLNFNSEGKYTVTATVNDQPISESLTLYVDWTPPQLNIALPLRLVPANPPFPDPIYLNGYLSEQNTKIRSKLGLNVVGADELLKGSLSDNTQFSQNLSKASANRGGSHYALQINYDPQTAAIQISVPMDLPETWTYNIVDNYQPFPENPNYTQTGIITKNDGSYSLELDLRDKAGNQYSGTAFNFNVKRTPPKAYGGSGYGLAWFMGTTSDCIQAWIGTPGPDTRATNANWEKNIDVGNIGHITIFDSSATALSWMLPKPVIVTGNDSEGSGGNATITVQDYAGNFIERNVHFTGRKKLASSFANIKFGVLDYLDSGVNYPIPPDDEGEANPFIPRRLYYTDNSPLDTFSLDLSKYEYRVEPNADNTGNIGTLVHLGDESFTTTATKSTLRYRWYLTSQFFHDGIQSNVYEWGDSNDQLYQSGYNAVLSPYPFDLNPYHFTSNPLEHGVDGQTVTPRVINLPTTDQEKLQPITIQFRSRRTQQMYNAYHPNFLLESWLYVGPSLQSNTIYPVGDLEQFETFRGNFVSDGPGLKNISDSLGGVGCFWMNAVTAEKKVVSTGSVATFTVQGGFLDSTISFSNFNSDGNYFHILKDQTDLIDIQTLGDNGLPKTPDPNKITILLGADGHLQQTLLPIVRRETEATRLQQFSVTAYIGSQVPVGKLDYEIKLGGIKGYAGVQDIANRGPNGGHVIKNVLGLIQVEVASRSKGDIDFHPVEYVASRVAKPYLSILEPTSNITDFGDPNAPSVRVRGIVNDPTWEFLEGSSLRSCTAMVNLISMELTPTGNPGEFMFDTRVPVELGTNSLVFEAVNGFGAYGVKKMDFEVKDHNMDLDTEQGFYVRSFGYVSAATIGDDPDAIQTVTVPNPDLYDDPPTAEPPEILDDHEITVNLPDVGTGISTVAIELRVLDKGAPDSAQPVDGRVVRLLAPRIADTKNFIAKVLIAKPPAPDLLAQIKAEEASLNKVYPMVFVGKEQRLLVSVIDPYGISSTSTRPFQISAIDIASPNQIAQMANGSLKDGIEIRLYDVDASTQGGNRGIKIIHEFSGQKKGEPVSEDLTTNPQLAQITVQSAGYDKPAIVVVKIPPSAITFRPGFNKLKVKAMTLPSSERPQQEWIEETAISYSYDPDRGIVFFGSNDTPQMRQIPLDPAASRIPPEKLKWFGTGQGRIASGGWSELYYEAFIGTKNWLTEDFRMERRETADPITFIEVVAHEVWADPIEFVFNFKRIKEDTDFVIDPPENYDGYIYAGKASEAIGLTLLNVTVVGGFLEKIPLLLARIPAKALKATETFNLWMKVEGLANKQGLELVAQMVGRMRQLSRLVLVEGYRFIEQSAFKLGGNQGFDDVLVKLIDGQEHFVICESKGGSSKLKYIRGGATTGGIKQMSEEWILDVLDRMETDPGKIELAQRIRTALDAGRVEGRICWTSVARGSEAATTKMTYRFYGPRVPRVVKELYRKASSW